MKGTDRIYTGGGINVYVTISTLSVIAILSFCISCLAFYREEKYLGKYNSEPNMAGILIQGIMCTAFFSFFYSLSFGVDSVHNSFSDFMFYVVFAPVTAFILIISRILLRVGINIWSQSYLGARVEDLAGSLKELAPNKEKFGWAYDILVSLNHYPMSRSNYLEMIKNNS